MRLSAPLLKSTALPTIMLPAIMLPAIALFAIALLDVGPSRAQGPVPGMRPQSDAPVPSAGQVPTLSQQLNSVTSAQGGAEPSRAPGSKADTGTVLPGANANSGTTTYFAPATETDKAVRWPCAQAKVSTISAGTIWTGPNVAEGKDWEDDNALAETAQKLASRRTSLDEANELIGDFAKKAGPDKDKQLTRLFVGTLDIINDSRSQILEGIMRYARGQERLAERMREESDKISEAQDDATAHGLGVATDQTNTDFAWDQRIFKERNQALSYVCETPSLLERRAYEIAKRIQAQI